MARTPEGPQRVFVVGGGVVSPQGLDWTTSWQATVDGKIAIEIIPDGLEFSPQNYSPEEIMPPGMTETLVRHGGYVHNLRPELALGNAKNARRRARNTHLVSVATKEAMEQSGIEPLPRLKDDEDTPDNPINLKAAQRIVTIGMGLGDGMNIIPYHMRLLAGERLDPTAALKVEPEQAATTQNQIWNFQGPGRAMILACASGGAALIDVANKIRNREATMGIAGAGDTFARALVAYAIYQAASALAIFREGEDLNPYFASMPFDQRRRGFVHAEGAAVAVLEGEDSVKDRGAENKILAEVVGWGETNDASPLGRDTEPKIRGQIMTMNMGIEMAGVSPEEIDYVNAHGTGTPIGDIREFISILTFRNNDVTDFHISGTKSMTGHGISWTGVKEFLDCVNAIRFGIIPPTPNHDRMMEIPEDLIKRWGVRRDYRDLGIIPKYAVKHPVRLALSNTFGFGGNNNAILVKEFEGF